MDEVRVRFPVGPFEKFSHIGEIKTMKFPKDFTNKIICGDAIKEMERQNFVDNKILEMP
ncbi:MAG: hypothetical protein G01um101433_851 [Parcubacteria group bacterium Gr01-1014_33]|nr:MAG: hypothetical protein G01um101433_851 [Parcubacteria group bacterium Gr01-1014_33]